MRAEEPRSSASSQAFFFDLLLKLGASSLPFFLRRQPIGPALRVTWWDRRPHGLWSGSRGETLRLWGALVVYVRHGRAWGQSDTSMKLSGSTAPCQDASSLGHGCSPGASGWLLPLIGCGRVGDGVQVSRPRRGATPLPVSTVNGCVGSHRPVHKGWSAE